MSSSPSKVLIVDDKDTGRLVLQGLLEEEGYELAFASNGLEALQEAERFLPDLILLDVMMPVMDGYEACRRIRSQPQLAEIPILMVTSLDDREARLKGIAAGADDFITKPFDRMMLQLRVETITRLNRYRRLHAERARFEWVVAQADNGYLIVNQDDVIIYSNEKARRMLDLQWQEYGADQQTSRDSLRAIYRSTEPALWDGWPFSLLAHTGEPVHLIAPETDQSDAYWLEIDAMQEPAGDAETLLLRLRDVTKEKNQRRLVWSFHNMLTHKLRTPLGHIIGSLSLLSDDPAYFAPEQIKVLADTAMAGGNRLQRTISDILHYVDSQRSHQGRGTCSLAQLADIIQDVAAQFEQAEVTYTTTVQDPDLELPLATKAVELIMFELLENAQKFHPQQSPQLVMTLDQIDATLCLRVSDDGVQLTPEQLERVWDPYYQAEKYFTGEVEGVGLGLSLIADFILSVGGRCRMQNRDDTDGVTVTLEMPAVAILAATST